MRLAILAFSVALLVLGEGGAPAADPAGDLAADIKLLKAAKVATDGPELLDYFRKRTLTDTERDRIQALIEQLGDDLFAVREQASGQLVELGTMAVPLLRQAVKHPDIEVVRRAERCLEIIDKSPTTAITAAAARQVARTRPADAAEVLLAYLPFADDDSIAEEVRGALAAVAVRDGKADGALLAALDDKLPVRRGAAAEALVRGGAAAERTLARRLLQDPEPQVRLEVALALFDARDREAVPVLIALLTDLPVTEAWRAEEVLYRLAGDQAPNVTLGVEPKERQQCREAWAGWWRDHADKIDLAKIDIERLLGYTLVVQMDNGKITGRVLELDRDGKTRWQIENLNYPIDAQVLPGNRVLLAEYRSSLVTERTFKGDVVWQRQVPNPVACQRLASGNTFIASRNQLLEIDRNGKQVFNYQRPNFDILTARKLRDGQAIFLTANGQCVRLDPSGKEVKSFAVGQVQMFTGIDVLPGGRILVPQISTGKVVEYDLDGRQTWSASVAMPVSAMRLPNGNTLVASMNNQLLIELDRSGKQVWSRKVDGRPWRAIRR